MNHYYKYYNSILVYVNIWTLSDGHMRNGHVPTRYSYLYEYIKYK